mmetsp:Transcript_34003/g.41880  ORF Transcript_34003/g.41880 Transcript_34003/m.41880 type:complete len:405 (+) Transcript_34003:62-1276(+)
MALLNRFRKVFKLDCVSKMISLNTKYRQSTAESRAKLDRDNIPSLKQFLSLEERKRVRRSLEPYKVPNFDDYLSNHSLTLNRTNTTVLQVNIGLHCNQSCNHCHVESSPQRFEMMNRDTVDRLLYLLKNSDNVNTIDITGGAPELNREFRYFVESIRKLPNGDDYTIIDRCNLTVLFEEGQENLKYFLRDNNCKLICSLPCYSKKNVNIQRGKGVFDKSINALIELNGIGYGIPNEKYEIDLVYNPVNGVLPGKREDLEVDYKRELYELFGIQFNTLHVFNNMPIKRFADFLYRRGELGEYMDLLVRNFNLESIDGLMCRNTVNVSWSGHVFDCDFNQMLEIPTNVPSNNNKTGFYSIDSDQTCNNNGTTVFDYDSLDEFMGHKVATDAHCYGCTAGAGSKCGT